MSTDYDYSKVNSVELNIFDGNLSFCFIVCSLTADAFSEPTILNDIVEKKLQRFKPETMQSNSGQIHFRVPASDMLYTSLFMKLRMVAKIQRKNLQVIFVFFS